MRRSIRCSRVARDAAIGNTSTNAVPQAHVRNNDGGSLYLSGFEVHLSRAELRADYAHTSMRNQFDAHTRFPTCISTRKGKLCNSPWPHDEGKFHSISIPLIYQLISAVFLSSPIETSIRHHVALHRNDTRNRYAERRAKKCQNKTKIDQNDQNDSQNEKKMRNLAANCTQ